AVGLRRRALQSSQPTHHRYGNPFARDRKVVYRLGGLATPELLAQVNAAFHLCLMSRRGGRNRRPASDSSRKSPLEVNHFGVSAVSASKSGFDRGRGGQ